MEQIKFKFDKVTLAKIGKGLHKAVFPSLAVGTIVFLKDGIDWTNGDLGAYGGIVAFALQTVYNVVKEYFSGK